MPELTGEGRQSADVAEVDENQKRIFEGRREELAGIGSVIRPGQARAGDRS